MGDVLQAKSISCLDPNEKTFMLHVKCFYDEYEDGYGVEVDSEDEEVKYFSFGFHNYARTLAEKLFDYMVKQIEELKDFPEELNHYYCVYQPNLPDDHLEDLDKIDDLVS